MSSTLIDDANGDGRNAIYLAKASDLAYCPESEGKQKFSADLGLEAKLFSVGNTQAYVGESDNAIVVAFRGTESPTSLEGIKDWLLTDAMNLLVLPEGQIGTDFAAAGVGARFHQGFISALGAIWAPMHAEVESALQRKDRPVWLTGHSLGGALAQLAAWRLGRSFVPVHQVYTFGAPMVGNTDATDAFNREFTGKVFRYVNSPDLVPKLPTVSLIANAYTHCEKEMGLGGTVGSALDFLKELAGRAVQGLLNASLMDDLWQHLKSTVGAHDITNYHKLVEN